ISVSESLRLVQEYAPINFNGMHASLRQNGVYLLVAKMIDGLGLVYARALRRELNAKLIIVGDELMPAPAEWDRWLATHGAMHPVNQLINALQRLGREGEDYLFIPANTHQVDSLTNAIATGEARFGAINGVFHADVMGDEAACELASLDEDEYARITREKMPGASALASALNGHSPDFVLLQSSLSTLVGGHGFCAYAAASAYFDAFAENQSASGTPWYAIDWDACLPPLMNESSENLTQTALMELAIKPDEVWTASLAVLGQQQFSRVAVTNRSLTGRRHTLHTESAAPKLLDNRDRPALETPYVAPRTELERVVADEMGNLLGISAIGVDDDFFALGGHSLLAIQAVTRLRKTYGVELPMRAFLYGTPTAAGIAAVLEESLAEIDSSTIATVENLLDDLEGDLQDHAAKSD
ncbi:MAG: KR domain-containing protein, partial [Pseudomonadota bacterium]